MKTHYLMLVFALLIGFTACDDDKNSVPQVTVPISLSAPDSVQNAVISNVTATLKNITTGKESTVVAAPNNVRATTTFDFTVTMKVCITLQLKEISPIPSRTKNGPAE